MVYGAYVVCHQSCLVQVGSTLQSHGEGVQTGPVGFALAVVLNAVLGEYLGNGRDDGGVESAGEQYSVGHIRHQLTLDGILQRIVYGFDAGRVVLHLVILHPVTLVVALHRGLAAPIVVSGQEGLIAFALAFECFQF